MNLSKCYAPVLCGWAWVNSAVILLSQRWTLGNLLAGRPTGTKGENCGKTREGTMGIAHRRDPRGSRFGGGFGKLSEVSGQAAQNGGGAFLLPYFISLLILGIPLCWAEWTMGRYGGQRGFNSAPGIFSVIWRNPISKYLSVFALMIPLVVYMYYVVVEAWCLGYAFHYLKGDLASLGADPAEYSNFFNSFVGASDDGDLFKVNNELLIFVGITFVVNFVLIYRGVANGIESFCKYAIPIMAVCALCVLVRVLTLSGQERTVSQGLGFMWNPDMSKLKETQTWIAAAGQIFFSLSVGFGVIVNYSSYLSKKDDVVLSGLTASSMNEFFEVCLGGLITLPAAFIFLGASAATFGTFSLGFNALPNVFAQMPLGRWFGFIWFLMLFLAAITSSLSMLQPVLAFLEEGLALKRRGSSTLLAILTILGSGFVLYFSGGTVAMDTFDFWVGTVFIYILAMVQAIIYGWVFGIERGDREAHWCSFAYSKDRSVFIEVCRADLPAAAVCGILLPKSAQPGYLTGQERRSCRRLGLAVLRGSDVGGSESSGHPAGIR